MTDSDLRERLARLEERLSAMTDHIGKLASAVAANTALLQTRQPMTQPLLAILLGLLAAHFGVELPRNLGAGGAP